MSQLGDTFDDEAGFGACTRISVDLTKAVFLNQFNSVRFHSNVVQLALCQIKIGHSCTEIRLAFAAI